jgi:hypothetical protein
LLIPIRLIPGFVQHITQQYGLAMSALAQRGAATTQPFLKPRNRNAPPKTSLLGEP